VTEFDQEPETGKNMLGGIAMRISIEDTSAAENDCRFLHGE
jgi:hypothetical protein